MPRHLISDAHEWINEIPTVPQIPTVPRPHSLSSSSPPLGAISSSQLQWASPFLFPAGWPLAAGHVAMAAPHPPDQSTPTQSPLPVVPIPVASSLSTLIPNPSLNPSSPSVQIPDPFPPLAPAAAQASIPPIPIVHPSRSTHAVSSSHVPSHSSAQVTDLDHLTHPPVPHQPSYAQVASGNRGTGFVRSHAKDVESFARLPRTGIKIISGTREGIPSFSFISSDLSIVENLYANALVIKFHGGRPSLESSHKEILSWGMNQPFSIGPLSSRAFLLRFQDDKDLLKVLTRPSNTLITFPYKVFRWHSLCHISEDSCRAPVWISLPRLPLQCFAPEFLESVSNKIGRFLCLDKATATLARPSVARMCVELDLRKPMPQFIWVGLFEGFKQPIVYERMPKFCNGCHRQGHTSVECSKIHLDNPQHQPSVRHSAVNQSTPSVRQNVSDQIHASIPNSDPLPTSTSSHKPPPPQSQATNPGLLAPCADNISNIPPQQQPASSDKNNKPHTSHQQPHQHQPNNHNKRPKSALSLRRNHRRHHKSVSFQPHQPSIQSNIEANQAFWNAVNRQVAVLNKSCLTGSTVTTMIQAQPQSSLISTSNLSSGQPSVQLPDQYQPKSPTSAPGPSTNVCRPNVCQNARSLITYPTAISEYNQDISIERDDSTACRTDSLNQPPLQPSSCTPDPATDVGTPSVCHNASESNRSGQVSQKETSLSSSVKLAIQLDDMQPGTRNSTSKSIKLKSYDRDKGSSLTQQQAEALDRFKHKVRHQTGIQGGQLSSSYSGNHFEALREDQSDDDDYMQSYNSDTDDGCVEPIEMGYQSADGRSSHKLKAFASSGMKTNKRHPNMPLNVSLRSRKELLTFNP